MSGCNQKTPLKPFEVVRAEAEAMSLEELQKTAWTLVAEIYDGKQKLDQLEAELNQLSPAERSTKKAKALDEHAGRVRGDVNARAQRYFIYADRIRALGGIPPKFNDIIRHRTRRDSSA